MRLSRSNSLVLVAASLMLSGCFRPWTYPGYGYGYPAYGSPMYGGGYQGYGGYQGIQTLQPGQYYDPQTGGTPTFAPATGNGLSPEPATNGGSGGTGDGGDATPYNPGAGGNPTRPVPMYNENGSGLQPPETEGDQIRENKLDLDSAPNGAQLRRVPSSQWANEPITPAGHEQLAHEPSEIEQGEMEAPTTDDAVPLSLEGSEPEPGSDEVVAPAFPGAESP